MSILPGPLMPANFPRQPARAVPHTHTAHSAPAHGTCTLSTALSVRAGSPRTAVPLAAVPTDRQLDRQGPRQHTPEKGPHPGKQMEARAPAPIGRYGRCAREGRARRDRLRSSGDAPCKEARFHSPGHESGIHQKLKISFKNLISNYTHNRHAHYRILGVTHMVRAAVREPCRVSSCPPCSSLVSVFLCVSPCLSCELLFCLSLRLSVSFSLSLCISGNDCQSPHYKPEPLVWLLLHNLTSAFLRLPQSK